MAGVVVKITPACDQRIRKCSRGQGGDSLWWFVRSLPIGISEEDVVTLPASKLHVSVFTALLNGSGFYKLKAHH